MTILIKKIPLTCHRMWMYLVKLENLCRKILRGFSISFNDHQQFPVYLLADGIYVRLHHPKKGPNLVPHE